MSGLLTSAPCAPVLPPAAAAHFSFFSNCTRLELPCQTRELTLAHTERSCHLRPLPCLPRARGFPSRTAAAAAARLPSRRRNSNAAGTFAAGLSAVPSCFFFFVLRFFPWRHLHRRPGRRTLTPGRAQTKAPRCAPAAMVSVLRLAAPGRGRRSLMVSRARERPIWSLRRECAEYTRSLSLAPLFCPGMVSP